MGRRDDRRKRRTFLKKAQSQHTVKRQPADNDASEQIDEVCDETIADVQEKVTEEIDVCVDDEENEDEINTTRQETPTSQSGSPTITYNKTSPSKKGKGTTNANVIGSGNMNIPTNNKKVKKRRSSGTSSEEERWLTAIESGKLDDVDDELKKIKDPKLMTARQRAIYDRGQDKEPLTNVELLMALPNGYREKEKPQTAEEIQKAVLKSQKRKQQADERREKDKKKTMERLLKKQDTNKQRGATIRSKTVKPILPMMSYKNTYDGATIQMPEGCEFPLQTQKEREPPKPQLCGVDGCNNRKVYSCSKTQVPLCSIECYRKNLASVQ